MINKIGNTKLGKNISLLAVNIVLLETDRDTTKVTYINSQ